VQLRVDRLVGRDRDHGGVLGALFWGGL
jgi:hypothetical protein